MGSDVHLDEAVEAHEAALREQKAVEAAILVVVDKMPRDEAVSSIKKTYMSREDVSEMEVVRGDDGLVEEYLSEDMDTPARPNDQTQLRQIHVVAQSLIDEFE